MRKLIYVASAPIIFDNLDGVAKKMIDQCNAFQKVGFFVDIIYRSKNSVYLYDVGREETRKLCNGKSYLSVLLYSKRIAGNYQYVYIRYPMSSPILLSTVKSFKKSGAKIVIEIPTYPYHKEGVTSMKGKLISFIDKLYSGKLYHYVDRICTYSSDNEIFGIRTIRTINGIDFSRFVPDTTLSKERVDLIAVSSMYKVHGYDRLIEGIYNYYKNGGKRTIHLHIVGKGEVDNEYKKLVLERQMQNHVSFYGMKYGDDLMKIYAGKLMGVNSLAINRKDLSQESTLKTKEYAAKGLPILSSSYVDAFSKDGNVKYVYSIPPDETPVDVVSLIEFIDSLYKDKSVEELRNDIRLDGKRTCDMVNTLKPIIDFFRNEEI